ncbi:MAG: hypothetical protein HC936_05385 [Leptolyngbyaceae cyanobacterium SU_3_3]|nr:hypothetical protein [Leptolyngbyaceae cyanobacterium SU_3_3]
MESPLRQLSVEFCWQLRAWWGQWPLWAYLVNPAWERFQELDAAVKEKSEQLKQQASVKQQIIDAKKKLTQVNQQRDQVYALFANERTIDTLLLDINQLIERNNAGRVAATRTKLNGCPAAIRDQYANISAYNKFEDAYGALIADAKLKKFTPDPKGAEVIQDSSLGAPINGKLKRRAINVEFQGNFNQTQSIFRTIERLQSLLLVKNLSVQIGDRSRTGGGLYEVLPGGNIRFLTNCQPDTLITTGFQMEALLPLNAADKKALQPTPVASPAASP